MLCRCGAHEVSCLGDIRGQSQVGAGSVLSENGIVPPKNPTFFPARFDGCRNDGVTSQTASALIVCSQTIYNRGVRGNSMAFFQSDSDACFMPPFSANMRASRLNSIRD